MFRWYRSAAKCYVYLSDVQVPDKIVDIESFQMIGRRPFRRVDGLPEAGHYKSLLRQLPLSSSLKMASDWAVKGH